MSGAQEAQMRDPLAPLPIAQDPARRDEWRARERLAYVRQHAPTLLAGLVANANGRGGWDELRKEAIEQSGLLFDETEPK